MLFPRSYFQVTSSKLKASGAIEEGRHGQAWCSSTLDFYGPKAGQLPKGSKIKEAFGRSNQVVV